MEKGSSRGAPSTTRARPCSGWRRSRAYVAETGGLPVRVTVLVEGEEEVGSPNFCPLSHLAANRDELRADAVVISDTGMWDVATPAITTRLRGSTYVEVGVCRSRRGICTPACSAARRRTQPTSSPASLGELHDSHRAGSSSRLLRRRQTAAVGTARLLGQASVRRAGVSRPHRPAYAGGRKGAIFAGAALGAADRRRHRHVERLYRARRENRHSRRGPRQGLVPPRAGAGSGRRGRRVAPVRVVAPAAGGRRRPSTCCFRGVASRFQATALGWRAASRRRSRRNMAADPS